jgi:DNA repair exonuclease SbcCD ATPase subunit
LHFQKISKLFEVHRMTTRGRDQLFPNGPGFNPGTSTLLSKSNTVVPCSDTLSPQIRTENPAVGAAHQMEKQQSLSSPPSAKGLRSRRVLESLVAENSRLRAELETIQSRQIDTLDRMVTDLVKTKSELRAKDVRLSGQQDVIEKQNTEMEQLRRDVSKLSAELQDTRLAQGDTQESAESKQAIGQLTTELREKDLHLREKDQILREREFELRAMRGQLEQEQKQRGKDAIEMQELQNMINGQDHTQRMRDDSQLETERSRAENLQQEVQDLKRAHASALSQIETGNARVQQYLDELSQSKATQDAAQSASDAERAKSQQYLQEINQRDVVLELLKSQIESEEAKTQKLTQELDNLQASFQRTVTETRNKSQAQEELEASHANDLAEAHRLAEFFRKNSVATSRKAKELEAETQSLIQSLQSNREAHGDGTTNAGQQDGNFSKAPGAWPDMDVQRNSPSLRRKPLAFSSVP